MEQRDQQWVLATVLILLHWSHMIQTSRTAAMRYIPHTGLNTRDKSDLRFAVLIIRSRAFNPVKK